MLRIKTCLLTSFMLISVSIFSQKEVIEKEIWGYNTLAGNEGGGAVFKVDPDDKTAEIIHRFDHPESHNLKFISNFKLFSHSNGLIYGIDTESNLDMNSYALYSYNPSNDSIRIIKYRGYKIEIIDGDLIYFTSYGWPKVYKYDIEADTVSELFSFSWENGSYFNGYWTKYDENIYYTLAEERGLYSGGTLVKIDTENDTTETIIDFNEDKFPSGSILKHSNDKFYFILQETADENYSQGGIFEFNPIDRSYTQLALFNEETGVTPYGELTEASDGFIYGLTLEEGDFGDGTIYRFNPTDQSIEVVYHFNNDSTYNMTQKIPGGFIQINDTTLMGVLQITNDKSSTSDKLIYLNLLSNEIAIVHDFFSKTPQESLTQLNGKVYGFSKYTYYGESFTFDPTTLETTIIDPKYEDKPIPENGQNPVFLCQGHDYNFYGMTAYGGKANGGIVFKIDYFSHEFTKMMDLADLDFAILPKGDGFALTPGKIIGISGDYTYFDWHKADENLAEDFIFEFDYMNNTITKLKEFSAGYIYDPQLRSDGTIYFSSAGTLYEYDYTNNHLNTTKPDSTSYGAVIPYKDNLYIGTRNINTPPYHMLYIWNRETGAIETKLSKLNFSNTPGRISPAWELFVSNDTLYGSVGYATSGGGDYGSYVYDLNNDTLIENNPLYGGFNNNYNRAMMETADKKHFIQSGLFIIKIYQKDQDSSYTIYLEDSDVEFINTYEYGYKSYPYFRLKVRTNLISAQPKKDIYHWTGNLSSNWNEDENWFQNKTPDKTTEVLIPPFCLNYPIIEESLETGNLKIEKNAEFDLLAEASLTSQSLYNSGHLKLEADANSIASIKTINTLKNNGKITYHFNNEEASMRILASPVNGNKTNDSTLLVFNGSNWNCSSEPSISLIPFKPYLYEMDSAAAITFGGDFNWGDQSFSFENNTNQWTPLGNPYAASFDWQQIDLSSIENKAVYSVDPIDSTIYSFVDGIGTLSPIIQPLDVFWVKAQSGEQFRLSNEDQIHKNEFIHSDTNKNELKIAVLDGVTKNQTIISFNNQASNEFEKDKDALLPQFENYQKAQIFTFAGEQKLAINQLPSAAIMDMAVKAEKDGTYNIQKLKNKDFDFVLLEDLLRNKRINLLEEEYSFDYFVSDGDYPFKLYFEPWALEPVNESDIDMYYYPETLVIRSRKQVEYADVYIYDLAGKLSLDFKMENSFYFEKDIDLPTGHYIVQFRTADVVINEKILVR